MLMTHAYLQEQQRLHKEDKDYATIGHKWAYLVAGIAVLERCKTILDYGCGKQTLEDELRRGIVGEVYSPDQLYVIMGYDPVYVDNYENFLNWRDEDEDKTIFDLVVCTDVMEHVEPECLENVITHITSFTKKFLFLVISTKFDKGRTLTDGRNSHLIVNEGPWWEEKFKAHGFMVKRTWNTGVKEWVALMEKV